MTRVLPQDHPSRSRLFPNRPGTPPPKWQPRFFTLDRSLLPDGMIPPGGISWAVVFPASDDAEFVTGVALPVDAGWTTF
jgi:NAD(P)-dependent dehydrogenase (short-subunit alcohol dehydrogenase family)